jgi:hypothetical protein
MIGFKQIEFFDHTRSACACPSAFMPVWRRRKQGRISGRPRLVLNRAKVMQLDEEGLTIREIAAEMGVSPASIQRILKSHHRPTSDLIPV